MSERLTFRICGEFQDRASRRITIGEFKALGRELRDRFGMSDKEALAIIRQDIGWVDIAAKYEEAALNAQSEKQKIKDAAELNEFELAGYSHDDAAEMQRMCDKSGVPPGSLIGALGSNTQTIAKGDIHG